MAWLAHIGLQKKSYIFVGSGLMTLIVILTSLFFQIINQSIEKLHQQRVAIVENVTSGIDDVVLHMRSEMVISASTLGKSWQDNTNNSDQDQLVLHRNHLQSHLATFHQMEVTVFFALLDAQGRVLQTEPFLEGKVGQSLTTAPAIRDSLQSGQVYIEVEEGILTGYSPTFSITAPIKDAQGLLRGLLVADIPDFPSAIGFGSLLQRWGTSYNLELITDGGLLLTDSISGMANEKSSHWDIIHTLWQERQSGIKEHQGNEETKAHIVAFARLKQIPWGVILEQPQEEILELPWIMGRRFLIAIGAAVLIAGGLIWGFTRQIISPIQRLATAVGKFGTGDLEAEVPRMGEDEIGRLAQSFETMRLQLKHSIDEINQWNQELERRVKERTNELEELYEQLRQQNEERSDLLGKIITTQEEERRRIARDLHDGVSQMLTGLVMSLASAETLLTHDPMAAKQSLESLRQLTSKAVEEVRRLIQDLRPSLLDDLGLIPAISWCIENYLAPTRVQAKLETLGSDQMLPPAVEIALFRVVQEAITNIVKHAQAKTALIRLEFTSSAITGTIEDDGKGFDVDTLRHKRGMGILGMQERIELLHGRFELESKPKNGGTRVHFEIPMEDNHG